MVSKPARNVADGIQDLTWSEMEGFVNNIMNAVAANDTNPRRRIAEALLTWAEAIQEEAEIEDGTEAEITLQRNTTTSDFAAARKRLIERGVKPDDFSLDMVYAEIEAAKTDGQRDDEALRAFD